MNQADEQKRVQFDFEVEFLNGGGIQGQGFRLDIEGVDIDDDALAQYIIADLRLLMVGRVCISNKSIINEAHKRSRVPLSAAASGESKATTLIDLSHSIEDGMITYRGLPAPIICDHLSREQSRELYAVGTEFQIGKITMVANTGTYIDSLIVVDASHGASLIYTPGLLHTSGRRSTGLLVPFVLCRLTLALRWACSESAWVHRRNQPRQSLS